MRFLLSLIFVFLLSGTSSKLLAQDPPEENLLRLLSAGSAEVVQNEFQNIRKVKVGVQFLHNNTYILCDSALWNVTENVVDAIGNVRIIQQGTTLLSEKIHYIADQSLAQVRGNLVELIDKEENRLRTNILDYYTKDSIGYFYNGGSVMNKDGNAIESIKGSYNAKIKIFKFITNVEIYSDSLMMKADSLEYDYDNDIIKFISSTLGWKNDSFLKTKKGYYNRKREEYFFHDSTYLFTKDQEIWADSILYKRDSSFTKMTGNVQITDTSQSTLLYTDKLEYWDKPYPKAIITKNPSLGYYTYEENQADTLFVSADTLTLDSYPYKDVDSTVRVEALSRRYQSLLDAFESLLKTLSRKGAKAIENPDTLKLADNTFTDTTVVRFIKAYHNVKLHRSNLQGRCDSLIATSIDSIGRMYGSPILWSDNNQFRGDSIQLVVQLKQLTKVELLSSAFTISQEDSIHFNQVKSTDIVGYFTNNKLHRFDALGGVNLLFFLQEDSVVTNMNQKVCRAFRAEIADNKLQRVKYIQEIKSDAFPIADLALNKQKLKGFNWVEDTRPKNRFDVSQRVNRNSQKDLYLMLSRPQYFQTERFFKKRFTNGSKEVPASSF